MTPIPARFHLAMVTAKYALAAFVSYLLAKQWVPADVLSAVFVASICLRASMVTAVRSGLEQLVASMVGAGTTLALLVFAPISAWTIGASIGATYAVSAWLRWPFGTVVVALFSSLYMTILAQDTLLHTALLRFQSVLLGVVVAIGVNLLFWPFSYRTNFQLRVDRGLAVVRTQLEKLAIAIAQTRPGALEGTIHGFGPTYRQISELMDDLSDLARDVRFQRRPGGLALVEVAAGDRALRELEWIAHYAQDVGVAVARHGGAPAVDTSLTERAALVLAQGLAVLDEVRERQFDEAGERARQCRQDLNGLLAAPFEGRTPPADPSAELALILGLVQVMDHLIELVHAARQLASIERESGIASPTPAI